MFDRANSVRIAICGACVTMLLLALARMPYAYYQFLRWAVCATGVWLCFGAAKSKAPWLAFVYAIVAVFYNPIAPFAMKRASWEVVNVIIVVVLLGGFVIQIWLNHRDAKHGRLPQGTAAKDGIMEDRQE